MYHTAHGATPDSAPAPPQLDGYEYRGTLGSGSTATVYRYLQHGTNREVAVKVSTARLDPKAGARFRTEANFMAKLSAHPYILSIYGAGITADGRSYIVFEYAPGGNLKDLLATRRFDAEETLDIGVNLASALATAHRNGIVHRDIKTSNVLITEQGLPALADFGISASVYDKRSTGFSLPWAPPEVLSSNGSGTDASDIYSLAATLYAMLAGRSPFEHGYRPRTMQELGAHIMNDPVPPLNRPDVPAQVERVLAKALSHNPEDRYYSAVEFARAMQQAQIDCYGHATPLTVEGVDRFGKAVLQRRGAHTATTATADTAKRGSSRGAWIAIGAAVAAVAAGVALFCTLVLPNLDHVDSGEAQVVNPGFGSQATPSAGAQPSVGAAVPSPTDVVGRYSGDSVIFTWKNPDPQPGDRYAWVIVDDDAEGLTNSALTTDQRVVVKAGDRTQTCIRVSIVREDRQMSTNPATICAAR